MGIRGLTSFIDHNHHILQEFELHNCRVVIDGSNLYHFLYHERHVRCFFGGDYDIYRKRIISTFESFKLCGITPYVVMDGAYTTDNRKLKTSISRASAKIRLVDAMNNVERGRALPCLAYETFMQVMRELEIPHVVCQFEADNEIAVLANKMKCSVISNDSDFYIFDITNGFLPLDYIDFNPLFRPETENSHSLTFLSCRKYSVDDFIGSFDGLNRSVLPLFASMLGNDYINPGAFETFYTRFTVPKIVSKKYQLPPNLSKVMSVLHWLHTSCQSDDSLEEKLFTFVKEEHKQRVLKLFQASINNYKDVENFGGFNLFEFFINQRNDKDISTSEDFHCQDISASENFQDRDISVSKKFPCQDVSPSENFQCYDGREFPLWFLQDAECGKLSPFILNAAVLHRVILLCQVEDLKLPSSYNCSQRPRQVLYGVLLSQCKHSPSSTKSHESETSLFSDNAKKIKEMEEVKEILGTVSEIKNDAMDVQCSMTDKCSEQENEEEEIVTTKPVAGLNKAMSPVHTVAQDNAKLHYVEEYNRVIKNLQKFQIYPVYEVNGLEVPGLHEMMNLSVQERRKVLIESLGVDETFVCKFHESHFLFASSLSMWIRNADPKVTTLHVDSVIACTVVLKALSHLERLRKKKKDGKSELKESTQNPVAHRCARFVTETKDNPQIVNLEDFFSLCELEELENLQKSTEKYHKHAPIFNHRKHFEPSVVHVFAQLQACLLDALHLNKLLRSPVPDSVPAELISGTFLYNLYTELRRRPQSQPFLASLLGGRGKPIHNVFMLFRDHILTVVDGKCCRPAAPSGQGSTARRKKRKSETEKPRKSESHDSEKEEEADDKDNHSACDFDPNNRFSLLSLN